MASQTDPPDLLEQYVQKYDALSYEFKTLQLEKEVYAKEIARLQEENAQLKEETELYRKESTTPSLSNALTTATAALRESEMNRVQSVQLTKKYKASLHELTEQVDALKQLNARYQETIEMLQNNQNKQKLEYENRLRGLQKEIERINAEQSKIMQHYAQQTTEYDALKVSSDIQLKKQMEVSTMRKSEPTVHLQFVMSSQQGTVHNVKDSINVSSIQSYGSNDDLLPSNPNIIQKDFAEDAFIIITMASNPNIIDSTEGVIIAKLNKRIDELELRLSKANKENNKGMGSFLKKCFPGFS
eukprot:399141_1